MACGCMLRDPWLWVSVNGHVWVSEGPWVYRAPGLWVFVSANLWMCSLTVLGACESWYPGRCGLNLSPSWLPGSGGKKTNLISCSRFLIFIKHLLCANPYSSHWGDRTVNRGDRQNLLSWSSFAPGRGSGPPLYQVLCGHAATGPGFLSLSEARAGLCLTRGGEDRERL